MNVELFAQQIQNIHWRIAEMYRGTTNTPADSQTDLLSVAFKELGIASEELQVASEELMQQTEELALTRSQLEAEYRHYKELFEFMPLAYLVTSPQGKIQEANHAAATLFNVDLWKLSGKLLIKFIPLQERSEFRSQLNQLYQCNWVQEWRTLMHCSQGQQFKVTLSVVPVSDLEGKLVSLRWIVRTINDRKQIFKMLTNQGNDLCQDRPQHFYTKGEVIPLEPQTIWLVQQGLVKLTTISEDGNEVLIGLASSSLPFSSCWTSLPTYQAIALSENVELVRISLSEVAASPDLAQLLFPKLGERIRQTESLLAIAGRRHIQHFSV